MKTKSIFLIILTVVLILISVFGIGIGVIYFLLASTGLCENTIVDEIIIGNKKAVLFVRNCGATTDYSKQISIIGINTELKNKGGNVMISDSDKGKAETDVHGGSIIIMANKNKDHLLIKYAKDTRFYKKKEKKSGIKIVYQEIQNLDKKNDD